MIVSPRKLRSLGIVGMNERNIDLIGAYNPRRLFPLVDNKLLTKTMATENRIATPTLLAAIHSQFRLRGLEALLGPYDGFAVKPAKGSGGKGILVITSRDGDNFFKASGSVLTVDEIRRHISDILAGLFSLGGAPDVAIIEALILPDPVYKDLSIEGVPDIRVIVYRGFPIMAMMRLSTRASDGKANLHQGAIGLGLSIADGRPVNAIQFDRNVDRHPDTGAELLSLEVPQWFDILVLAARAADATGLGYIGADIVIDRERGPLLLELNARPGLAIQIANQSGLAPRIRAIDALEPEQFEPSADIRVQLSVSLFR
jgi:alpha-L-glutamate ligase-like protein